MIQRTREANGDQSKALATEGLFRGRTSIDMSSLAKSFVRAVAGTGLAVTVVFLTVLGLVLLGTILTFAWLFAEPVLADSFIIVLVAIAAVVVGVGLFWWVSSAVAMACLEEMGVYVRGWAMCFVLISGPLLVVLLLGVGMLVDIGDKAKKYGARMYRLCVWGGAIVAAMMLAAGGCLLWSKLL